MTKNYDEQTDFTSVTGDNNQNTEASIQPIAGGENLWEEPLNRAPENLRQRTEVLRKAVDDLRYYADYDRHFTLTALPGTTFTFTPDPGPSTRSVLAVAGSAGANVLRIIPTLTPGANSGGRALGAKMFVLQGGVYVDHAGGTSNELTIVASSLTTGMRGYADTDDLADVGYWSLGGNRLRLTLAPNSALAGGLASISVTVSGTPATNFTIAYGTATTATTLAQLIAFINSDNDLGGSGASYGLSNVFYATTTVPDPTLTAPPPLVDAVFQGGYDAEEHWLTQDAFNTFFTNAVNRLEDGEALAMAFTPGPVEDTTVGQGGRRQALRDLPLDRTGGDGANTASDPILFNTGREPEKIPGSIAIGKRVGDLFYFIDGTAVGTTPTSLGETPGTRARTDTLRTELASATAPTGASLVGFLGTELWNDGTGLSSTTVQTAINEIVSDLAESVTNPGSDKIGAPVMAGYATLGNTALDLPAGSVYDHIRAVTNDVSRGLNVRVSEYGHRMHGPEPIEKIFSETGPAGDLSGGGGQLIRAVLNPSAVDGFSNRFNREEQASIYLEPLTYPQDGGDGDNLTENEPFGVFSASVITITSMGSGRAEKLRSRIAVTSSAVVISIIAGHHCVVKLSGLPSGNGFYFLRRLNPSDQRAYLVALSGATPTLPTGATGTVTFYRARIVGSSASGTRIRSMLLWDGKTGADAEYYGSGYIAKGYSEDAVLEHTASVTEAEWSLTDTAIINSGSGATVSSVVSGVSATIVGLSGMEAESVGNYLDLTSGTPANNGLFRITSYVSPASVVVNNMGAVVDVVTLKWDEIASAARRTPNILIDADARLLKGRENNATVDATRNHHHDSRYELLAGSTRTIFYDGPQTLSLTSPWGSDIASLAVAGTTTVTTYATIPTGFTKTAAILRAEVAGHTDLTGAVGETVRLRIGMRRIGLDNENILALQHLKPTTTINAFGSVNFGTSGGLYATDGDTLFISDGTYSMTFEYDSGGGVTTGRTAVPFTTIYTPAQMASALTMAINSVGPLQITAEVNVLDSTQVRLTNTRSNSGASGNIPITLTATDPLFSGEVVIVGMGGGYSAREELYKSEQILVPVDSDRTFGMVILAKTSNLDTDVALTLTEIGAVITPTP
jgi:hypothetical protein